MHPKGKNHNCFLGCSAWRVRPFQEKEEPRTMMESHNNHSHPGSSSLSGGGGTGGGWMHGQQIHDPTQHMQETTTTRSSPPDEEGGASPPKADDDDMSMVMYGHGHGHHPHHHHQQQQQSMGYHHPSSYHLHQGYPASSSSSSSSYSMTAYNHGNPGYHQYGMYGHHPHPSSMMMQGQHMPMHQQGGGGGTVAGVDHRYGGGTGEASSGQYSPEGGGGGGAHSGGSGSAMPSDGMSVASGSGTRPSPDSGGRGTSEQHHHGAQQGSFPPSHAEYHPHQQQHPAAYQMGAAGSGNPAAAGAHHDPYGYHHPGGAASSSHQQYYFGYNQGGSSASVSSSRPSSQLSVDMPGPEPTGPHHPHGMGAMMGAPGYYHDQQQQQQHPQGSAPSHGYHHYSHYQQSMPPASSSSYHQYHHAQMATYPHNQYTNGPYPQAHSGYYHPSMVSTSGSVTPNSQMTGMTFADASSVGAKRQQLHGPQQSHQHHHHQHHSAQLSKSFSSELDDSSRTSSPSGIPAPPHRLHSGVPMSAPAKIRVPIAARPPQHDHRADALGPLRESSQRLNVLNEASSMDSAEDTASRSDPPQGGGAKVPADSAAAGARGPAGKAKRTTSIHDASLLLGLRTSCSGSPATLPTVTDDTLMHDPSDDEDATVTGGGSATTLDHRMARAGAEDFVPYIPKNYPTRLARPQDRSMLNSLHCYIRSNLLELFVVEKTKVSTPNLSPSTSLGRVGLRCVYCAEVRKRTGGVSNSEAPMAVFYPKAVKDIYRMVTSWQRCHLRKCRNLPPSVRAEWDEMREHDKSRGKTVFWLTSAKDIGLVDCESRAGGVRFAPLPPGKTTTPTQTVEASYFTASSVPTPAARDRNDSDPTTGA
jgi:hypothetical protein